MSTRVVLKQTLFFRTINGKYCIENLPPEKAECKI
jgi:hypothetical protein